MRSVILLLVSSLGMGLAGCQQEAAPTEEAASAPQETAPAAAEGPVVKIWVFEDGTIEMDGEPAGLEAVRTRFAELQKQQGVVYYGRDAPAAEPHENAMRIIELVVKNNLPVQLSSKPDFSDHVDADGTSRPKPVE